MSAVWLDYLISLALDIALYAVIGIGIFLIFAWALITFVYIILDRENIWP